MTNLSHTGIGRTLSAIAGALLLSSICLTAALAPAAPAQVSTRA